MMIEKIPTCFANYAIEAFVHPVDEVQPMEKQLQTYWPIIEQLIKGEA